MSYKKPFDEMNLTELYFLKGYYKRKAEDGYELNDRFLDAFNTVKHRIEELELERTITKILNR